MVNESPWGGHLSMLARRFVREAVRAGNSVPAVYFRGDGAYNAQHGTMSDGGLAAPSEAWLDLSRAHGIDLLLCSAAGGRRLGAALAADQDAGFREAGLVSWWALQDDCDRVVTF